MKKHTGILGGLFVGIFAGGFLVGPWILGQPAGKAVFPKELASYRDVVKQVLPAVVSLDTEVKPTAKGDLFKSPDPGDLKKFFEDFPPGPKGQPKQGFGSGVVIDPDGVIMTTYHVVAGYSSVTVNFLDGSKFVTTDIRGDKKTDLAIVKIDTKGKKLPFLELADSDQMEIGDRVLAIGAPFGLRGSVTAGIISGKGRSGLNMNVYEDFLQTDAAINPGNSGGPLVNLEGKVVGINAAIKSKSGGFDGVGLAVASNLANSVKDALIKFGKVQRGYLGAQVVDLDSGVAEKLGLAKNTGVVVSTVFKNTPAGKVGLKAGDIITKIADKTFADGKKFQELIAALPLNKQVAMEILRDGKPQTLTVVLEEQPDTFGQATAPVSSAPSPPGNSFELDNLGMGLADLTPALASKLGYEAGTSGAAITKVDPGSLAQAAGLQGGMLIVKVDNQPISGAVMARDLLAKGSLANGILLQVRSPQGGTNYVLLKTK